MMMEEPRLVSVDPHNPLYLDVMQFLAGFSLKLDKDVEKIYAAVVNGKVIGTCSYARNVIKSLAIDPAWQNMGVAPRLLTLMNDELFARGIRETFIFSKPENVPLLSGLGYRTVMITPEVALLEGGLANIRTYIEGMYRDAGCKSVPTAGLVMNCNPFTLGHRYIIEKAAAENEQVIVFLVQEDASVFPFSDRMEILKRGTKDLTNVRVIPAGLYIISHVTFPSYFYKTEDEAYEAYVGLDAAIFGRYIAPVFHIKTRYIGTEPFCPLTSRYNEALLRVLPGYGVKVCLVEREKKDGEAISASRVRAYLSKGNWEEIRKIVPESTYHYLLSPAMDEVKKRLEREE